jgi:hypothetical protein
MYDKAFRMTLDFINMVLVKNFWRFLLKIFVLMSNDVHKISRQWNLLIVPCIGFQTSRTARNGLVSNYTGRRDPLYCLFRRVLLIPVLFCMKEKFSELQRITVGPAFIRSWFMNLFCGGGFYNPRTSVGISVRFNALIKIMSCFSTD